MTPIERDETTNQSI